MWRFLMTLSCCLLGAYCQQVNKFPDGFLLGAATASYQVEGAWNESGKGENIWDRLTHEHPDWIADGSNGDVACDSYHKYQEDAELVANLGFDVYRFSLSWSRLLPSGDWDVVNPAGIEYYNNLIDALLERNIQPLVTLFHWDLPQKLQDIGGWPNPRIADYFEEYARLAFENFGDRVKWWLTFNEPNVMCSGYGEERQKAPAINAHGFGEYMCGYTLLLGHARAYRLYDSEYRATQNGSVGITLNSDFYEPASDSQADIDAAERAQQFHLGWFAHPIFSEEGNYPAVMIERVDNNSLEAGIWISRLPKFTAQEIEDLKGSADFFGLNHYSTYLVTDGLSGLEPSILRDTGVIKTVDPSWPESASSWLKVVPWGFRKLLNWIARNYNNPPVFVTENGFSDRGTLDDTDRQEYYKQYLAQLLMAVNIDGNNVIGYTAWSLLDNFEWMSGYTEKFGIYHVDFESPNRTRTAKGSVEMFQNITATREIPESYFNSTTSNETSAAMGLGVHLWVAALIAVVQLMFGVFI
ncbi:myrosinase 1-like [Schistocerca piceifrons]|uniref:myrosinase 1-like n=1 Tax=Schistocerca piceifrons TaxID=274613 RepID=UPI001F5EE2AC|nr:myrosinase 1-like [Schistocerca piceifrons]